MCLYLNIGSESMPRGLYHLAPPGQPQTRLALLCLPRHLAHEGLERGYLGPGFCPGGAAALVKPLVGLPGDRVEITAEAVIVNGWPLAHSAPLAQDHQGRPLSPPSDRTFVVPPGHVFALSTFSPRSWDGRYWGPLPRTTIRASVSPLFLADPLPLLPPLAPTAPAGPT